MSGSSSSLNHNFKRDAGVWGSSQELGTDLSFSIKTFKALTSSISPGILWKKITKVTIWTHYRPLFYNYYTGSKILVYMYNTWNKLLYHYW